MASFFIRGQKGSSLYIQSDVHSRTRRSLATIRVHIRGQSEQAHQPQYERNERWGRDSGSQTAELVDFENAGVARPLYYRRQSLQRVFPGAAMLPASFFFSKNYLVHLRCSFSLTRNFFCYMHFSSLWRHRPSASLAHTRLLLLSASLPLHTQSYPCAINAVAYVVGSARRRTSVCC